MNKFPTNPLKAPTSVAGRPNARTSLISGQEKRRGVRLNSRVPVAVEWDAGGEVRRGETKTRVIGPYGCLVVLPQDLRVDQRISVINLVSSQASPAVIVWRGHEGASARVTRAPRHSAEGFLTPLEFDKPFPMFWQISFPPSNWKPNDG